MTIEKRFSIQKHEALDTHYLLNLETSDGMYSWAIPMGPSQDPRVKRLAFPVKNEIDLDYEGWDSINKFSESSGGRVIVWDAGTYRTFELDGQRLSAHESLHRGKLELFLKGTKTKGGFTLLRVEDAPSERWFFMKTVDDDATLKRDPVLEEPESVVSGRSLEQLTGEFRAISRDSTAPKDSEK